MKETLTLTIKLFVITAIVAALLGSVNMITSPIIAENTEATFNANLKELLPEADKFDLDGTKLPDTDATVTVNGIYSGMLNDGTVVGYVADAVCTEGYGGDIAVMVGIDTEGNVTKVMVTEMSETPGLGAKCQTEWIDQYVGLTKDIVVNKNGSAGSLTNKIDAISGATITSKAVTKAVNASLDAAIVVINDNMVISDNAVNPEDIIYDEGTEPVLDVENTDEMLSVEISDDAASLNEPSDEDEGGNE